MPKRGAGSSTVQSAEKVRSETSLSIPELCSCSPALFQSCADIIERFTGHGNIALSKALLRIADRFSTRMDDLVQLAFKMDQHKLRTSMPEAVFWKCVKRGDAFLPFQFVVASASHCPLSWDLLFERLGASPSSNNTV